jgi:hypothetical protein
MMHCSYVAHKGCCCVVLTGSNLLPATGSGRAGTASLALSRTPTQTQAGPSLHGASSANMDTVLAAAAAGMESAVIAPAAPASPAPSSVGAWAPDEAPGQIGRRGGWQKCHLLSCITCHGQFTVDDLNCRALHFFGPRSAIAFSAVPCCFASQAC